MVSVLPWARPGLPVRPVHLDHGHALAGQVPGQPGPVRAGALHPDGLHVTEGAQEPQQGPVSGWGGRERVGAQHPAELVARGRDMHVGVGVDTADDNSRR
jgi:hypothetical protein